jgi:hypothetical protein
MRSLSLELLKMYLGKYYNKWELFEAFTEGAPTASVLNDETSFFVEITI